jgi:PAS domain S-box-containing protein
MKQDKSRPKQAGSLRKRAEEEIIRFASFPKLNPNPVLEVDSSGKITFHNDAAVAVLKKFNLCEDVSVFLPEDIKELLAGLKQKKEGQFYRELIIKGKIFEETIYLTPQFNSLRIYAVDITERKRAEKALHESESKYRSLFANMISGFAYHQIVLDKNGKPVDYIFLEINDAFEKLTGLKRENIIGQRATEIIPGIENDPAGWINTYGEVALSGKEIRFENYSETLSKWYSIAAYSPEKGYFVAIFDDITQRKQTEESLSKSEEEYRELVQNANSAIIRWKSDGTITFFNEYAQAFFGWSANEAIGRHVSILVPERESTGGELTGLVEDIVDHPERYMNNVNENICRDGRRVWMTWTNRAIRDERGQVTEILTVGSDITERTQKEEELRRLNRTLMALGKSSKAMMRARNESEYLNDVCRIIVEDCGHAMVWIGFAEDDDARTVRPVAYAGFEKGYIETLKITWADTPRGRGPTGTAIRTGQPSICRNMQTDPLFTPWREEAIKRGYASSVVVPLMDGGKAIGAINIYAREPDPFTEDEITLLSELADDLSYGISSIRLKVAHDRAEEAIRQSEERYRSLVEVSPDAVFVNRGDRIVFANPAALHLFGATDAEQVLGKSPFEMFEPGYHSIMRKRIETLLGGESVPLIEGRIVRLDGTRRDVEVAAAPFNDSAGRAIQVILRDITERKQMEGKLRRAKDDLEIRVQERTLELKKSEHKYRILIEQAADGIVLLDRELNLVDVNTTACRMTGFTREELLKLNARDLYQPGEFAERPLRLDKVLAGETVITERRATKKDGSPIEVEISAKLIEGGQIQAIVRDITGRKVEERRTNLITELLELFAKKTSRKDYLDSVVQFLHDWTGCRSVGIRVVNKERYIPYDSYIGFSDEFMRKENMISLDSDACACIRVVSGNFEPQDASSITPNGSFRLENSLQFAKQLTDKELARFRGNCIRSGYASIAVIPIRYHNQPLGAVHLADEKKDMVPLDAVHFLESMAAPLIGEAIYRFSTEEELTKHRHHLEEMVKERTRELHDSQTDLNRAQTVAQTGSWRLDVRRNELLWSDENHRIFGITKGTPLTYETFLSTVHPDDRESVQKQWSAALHGESYDIEHRIVVNGQVKWVQERAELEFDKDGILQGGFGTTQDITEKKHAEKELQTLMEELKRSNADLEQFAYAASHDLQEPLRVVAGFVSLLEKRYKDKLDDKAYEFIEYALDGVKRMQVLIKDLLAYSQVGTKTKTFKPTICSVALEQAIYNLHAAIEESGAEITYDFLPTISADTSQLTRLFQNLIGNAIKFRGKDRLKIHISAEQKGNEWVFSIRDNGIGIDPKYFDRIFEVFQRLHTREKYEGTGIGLAVCKKIVERHGGHIRVESEPGKGTTFYFTMPVME